MYSITSPYLSTPINCQTAIETLSQVCKLLKDKNTDITPPARAALLHNATNYLALVEDPKELTYPATHETSFFTITLCHSWSTTIQGHSVTVFRNNTRVETVTIKHSKLRLEFIKTVQALCEPFTPQDLKPTSKLDEG